MQGPQSLGLVDEGSLVLLRQQLPLTSKSFRNFRIVHFWIFLSHFPPLSSGPNHESIHWSFHSIGVFAVVQIFGVGAFNVIVVRWGGRRSLIVGVVRQGW